MTKQKVFVETYGCQMNVYDTELVHTILKDAEFDIVEDELSADVVLLNTCSVRDNANRKVYNRVHNIHQSRDEGVKVCVGILGCMATNFKKELIDNPKLKIDFIAGPDSYRKLPALINETFETGKKTFDVTLSEFETYSDVYPSRQTGVNAWIAIMRGCDNFCTFCVVPYTRGKERSRDPRSIVDEVKRLVDQGFKQVTLLGQNVNSYAFENTDFADLMALVSDVPGIERIRFTSPHPKDFPSKLLHVMSERSNICNQIHFPLQAGNDRVLKKMNRTYTKETFLSVVDEIRSIIPGISLSTDVIVGFPSETDEEFEDTVDVMKKVEFDAAFIFKYSERPGTTAARRFPDDVPEAIKTERIVLLNDLQKDVMLRRNQSKIGQTERVLIEVLETKKDPDHCVARTDGNTIVILPKGGYQIGDSLMVSITDATPHVLKGIAL